MISKTTQPTLINWPSNNSPYDAKFTECGDSESSFSFESYAFSNNCLLFIDYIRSHVCLCTVLLYSKASSLCYLLLTVGWYTQCGMRAHAQLCIKVGLLYSNACRLYYNDVKYIQNQIVHVPSWLQLQSGHYQCYNVFITPMATGQVVDLQWLYLIVGHLCQIK